MSTNKQINNKKVGTQEEDKQQAAFKQSEYLEHCRNSTYKSTTTFKLRRNTIDVNLDKGKRDEVLKEALRYGLTIS